jgi:dATP pyrophosphohydrolase
VDYKIPESVLVVIHTRDLMVLLLERAGHAGFWQSVTGSRAAPDEPLIDTAIREVAEETGIDANQFPLADWQLVNRFEIFARWRNR